MHCPRLHELALAVCLTVGLSAWGQSTWRVDSAMATWPLQQAVQLDRVRTAPGVIRAMDTRDLHTALKREAPGIPVFADELVAYYVDLYGERNREQFRAMLGMAANYFPLITSELTQAGLPSELMYLPMALSGMNTLAGSVRGEAGLWMLTYPVAIKAGLIVTADVDERRDALLATRAAVAELKRIKAQYPDPQLFLLAATCGPANVERALMRSKGANDLRTLYTHVDPAQRDVLPLLMAFLHLSANARTFGIEAIPVDAKEEADTVHTSRPLRPSELAACLDMPASRLHALNPTLCGRYWPAYTTLLLPKGTKDRFDQCHNTDVRTVIENGQNTEGTKPLPIPTGRTVVNYKVRAGDSLGAIAERHGVTVHEIKTWNELRSDRIAAGDQLVLYVRPSNTTKDEERPTPPAKTGQVHKAPGSTEEFIWYTVRKGDSLYAIAKRYPGVDANDLMRINGISDGIRPGQRIKIPKTK
ncbi:MAG: LysM peptidoglycan-binding domain-containing protein [Flavobacteriales bacterium]|nr:LysM peptidoglycan-binding domain-containing protein [Flavobacteriales bacterium]